MSRTQQLKKEPTSRKAPPTEPSIKVKMGQIIDPRIDSDGQFGSRQLVVPIVRLRGRAYGGAYHVLPGGTKRGTGWLPDIPDIRDATLRTPPPPARLRNVGGAAGQKTLDQAYQLFLKRVTKALGATPPVVDNSAYCSEVENQGDLGSCTANACAGMVEYLERRGSGMHIDASRLFLYKMSRTLLGFIGDTGSYLRTTMKALVLFGMPPESVSPYEISNFDDEPTPYLYAYASNYKALQYLRLDPADQTPAENLDAIRAVLATGFVTMFGFPVYSSMGWNPDIPYPNPGQTTNDGHALLAVGYDDNHENIGTDVPGALLIRNSWGFEWGNNGYGWLPYQYVLTGLANDFWTCFKLEWVDTDAFEF